MPDAVWLSTGSVAGSGFEDCGTCGASVLWRNRRQHENFHKTFSNLRGEGMSKVSWCDYGDHAFKTGEKGSASFNGTEYDENGVPVQTAMDACSKHNPLNQAREAAKYSLTTEEYREVSNPE